MTKLDLLNELDEVRTLARGQPSDFFRGQVVALDYAIEMVAKLKPYSVRKTAKTMEIRLTPEQERHIESLLGDGELDRLLRIKLTRARNEYLASND